MRKVWSNCPVLCGSLVLLLLSLGVLRVLTAPPTIEASDAGLNPIGLLSRRLPIHGAPMRRGPTANHDDTRAAVTRRDRQRSGN